MMQLQTNSCLDQDMNLIPTNMVLVAQLEFEPNLSALFDFLPILWIDFAIRKWRKMPYFGHERTIVSVRYKSKHRGVRSNKGQLKNSLSLDLQLGGKNLNIRVSSSCFHITGATSVAMAQDACTCLVDFIAMVTNNWFHILAQPNCEELKHWAARQSSDTLEIPTCFDEHAARCLLAYCFEPETIFKPFVPLYKANGIENARRIKLSFLPPVIANSVYNYSLGKSLSCLQTGMLLDSRGYSVSYQNWKSSNTFNALKPVYEEGTQNFVSPTINKKGKEVIRTHVFVINKNGTVWQFSPTDVVAANVAAMELVNTIRS